MKKLLLSLVAAIVMMSAATAQWVSPGNGTTYDMNALVAASNGAVTMTGENAYSINEDVTISAGDTWNITSDVSSVSLEEVTVTVNGTVNADGNMMNKIPFAGNRVQFTLRLENATAYFMGVMFSQGGEVKVISSDAEFRKCEFLQFKGTSAAVSYMDSNPVFEGCYFHGNEGAAISSGINVQGSPEIRNCIFENNVTTNQNLPQINLGPGATDTIYIVGNTITGGNSIKSGGISISDVAGVGDTKVRIENNTIVNNRYGINQQGMKISSVICYNDIYNNNIENDPMTGGSGISIYGLSTDCKAKIRHNDIMGNLYGITSIYLNDIDLGTDADWGYNIIYKNVCNNEEIALYNNSTCDIMAIGNYWGASDGDAVEKCIYHGEDDPSLGWVSFKPFLTEDGVVENIALKATVTPNPVTNGMLTISFDKETHAQMVIYNAAGQMMRSTTLDSQINNINVDYLESGVYFVVIRSDEGNVVEKIVKR